MAEFAEEEEGEVMGAFFPVKREPEPVQIKSVARRLQVGRISPLLKKFFAKKKEAIQDRAAQSCNA